MALVLPTIIPPPIRVRATASLSLARLAFAGTLERPQQERTPSTAFYVMRPRQRADVFRPKLAPKVEKKTEQHTTIMRMRHLGALRIRIAHVLIKPFDSFCPSLHERLSFYQGVSAEVAKDEFAKSLKAGVRTSCKYVKVASQS